MVSGAVMSTPARRRDVRACVCGLQTSSQAGLVGQLEPSKEGKMLKMVMSEKR